MLEKLATVNNEEHVVKESTACVDVVFGPHLAWGFQRGKKTQELALWI